MTNIANANHVDRVLIVDDNALIRRHVRSLLAPFNEWQICGEAENGEVAIELHEQLKPDVVIMDISMPRLNGLEASRRILAENPDASIILLTLYLSADLLKDALLAGVQGYVLKPEADGDLVPALRSIHERRIFVSGVVDRKTVDSIVQQIPERNLNN